MNYDGLSDGSALMRAARETLRQVQKAREALDTTPAGKGASMLCVAVSLGDYPTNPKSVFAVSPVELDCTDDEGATATPAIDTDQVFFAVGLGTAIPAQGTDQFVVFSCGGKWVFRFDGG